MFGIISTLTGIAVDALILHAAEIHESIHPCDRNTYNYSSMFQQYMHQLRHASNQSPHSSTYKNKSSNDHHWVTPERRIKTLNSSITEK